MPIVNKNNNAAATIAPHPMRCMCKCSVSVFSSKTLIRYFSLNRFQKCLFFFSSVIFSNLSPIARRVFHKRLSLRLLLNYRAPLARFELFKEVIAFIIHQDECREVLHFDFPDGFHAEFRILYALNRFDILLCQDSSRTTD